MAFKKARSDIIAALETGAYSHEARETQRERNLLAVGDVDEAFVIALLKRASGSEYRESPHHSDAAVPVHIFLSRHGGKSWYVKAYFMDDEARFISVHPTDRKRP